MRCRNAIASLLAAGCFVLSTYANAQAPSAISGGVVKIAIMGDLTGTTSDWSGQGAMEAVRLAIEDFGSTVAGAPVEMVTVDHQNKPDIGAAQAREMFDVGNVDMIVNLSNSSV